MAAWQKDQVSGEFFSACAAAWDREHTEQIEHNASVMYRAPLRREKEHFAGRKIQDIGPDEIDAYIKHVAGQGYGRWGVQVYLDMLRGENILPKKAGLPPGVGREPTSQVLTCAGPNGTAY